MAPIFNPGVSVSPDLEQVDYRAIGDSYRDRGQWREAAEAYCRHLELHPEDDAIWVQCGNCFKETGNFARSLTAYKKAEQLSPTDFDVHLQLGHLNKVAGNLVEALRCYERAARLNPDFGETKHEIQDVMNRINSGSPLNDMNRIFASLDQLIAFLRLQSDENDVFRAYFRSVGGLKAQV